MDNAGRHMYLRLGTPDLGVEVEVGLRHAPGNWQLNGQSPGQAGLGGL